MEDEVGRQAMREAVEVEVKRDVEHAVVDDALADTPCRVAHDLADIARRDGNPAFLDFLAVAAEVTQQRITCEDGLLRAGEAFRRQRIGG